MTSPERRLRKRLLIGIPILLLVVLALLPHEDIHWSAICPKCLQHAYIREKKLFGVKYHQRLKLSQAHGGIMCSAVFSPDIPGIDPKTYDDIFGEPCDHAFQKGGFGSTRGIMFGLLTHLDADGIGGGWRFYRGRVRAIQALYDVYGRIGDRALAKENYGLIETAQPAEDFKMLSRFDHDLPAMLIRLGDELTSAASVEEWRAANDGFAEKVSDLEKERKEILRQFRR